MSGKEEAKYLEARLRAEGGEKAVGRASDEKRSGFLLFR